jgi:malate permease and related proteins
MLNVCKAVDGSAALPVFSGDDDFYREGGTSMSVIMAAAVFMILLGMLMLRAGIVRRQDVQVLNTLIITVGMPSLVFLAVWRSSLTTEVLKIPILANITVLSCLLIAYVISRYLKMPPAMAGAFIIAAGFGNTAFLGFPLVISVFGAENLVYAVFYDQFSTGLLGLSLGAGIAAWYGKGSAHGRDVLKNIVRFPPVWGLIMGFLLQGFALPDFLVKSLEYLSALVVPLVMISLGMSLRVADVSRSLPIVIAAALIKLIISPLMLMVAARTLNVTGIPYQVSLMEASMPSMMMTLSYAIKYELDVDLTASIILITLLFSIFSIPLILSLL